MDLKPSPCSWRRSSSSSRADVFKNPTKPFLAFLGSFHVAFTSFSFLQCAGLQLKSFQCCISVPFHTNSKQMNKIAFSPGCCAACQSEADPNAVIGHIWALPTKRSNIPRCRLVTTADADHLVSYQMCGFVLFFIHLHADVLILEWGIS